MSGITLEKYLEMEPPDGAAMDKNLHADSGDRVRYAAL
jgi:hypothetical protein